MEVPFDRKISEVNEKISEIMSRSEKEILETDLKEYKWNEGDFSLTSFLKIETSLLRNRHFIEMYRETTKLLSSSHIEKTIENPTIVGYLYVFLSFFLCSLLTEATTRHKSGELDAFQKIIDDIYFWYRDKRRSIVRKRLNEDREFYVLKNEDKEEKEEIEIKKRIVESSFRVDDDPSAREVDQSAIITREKKKQMFISNKLKQYSHRNLEKSLYTRKKEEEEENEAEERTKRYSSRKKRKRKRKRKRGGDEKRRKGWLRGGLKDKHKELLEKLEKQEKLQSKKEEQPSVFRHWIRHRARDAQDRLENIEFQNTVEKWYRNTARIEEEIQRRQESLRYASQTGVNVYNQKDRNDDEEKDEHDEQKTHHKRKRRKKKEENRERNGSAYHQASEDPFLEDDDFSSDEDEPLYSGKSLKELEKGGEMSGHHSTNHRNGLMMDVEDSKRSDSLNDQEDDEESEESEEDEELFDEDNLNIRVNPNPTVDSYLSPYENLKKEQKKKYNMGKVKSLHFNEFQEKEKKVDSNVKMATEIVGIDEKEELFPSALFLTQSFPSLSPNSSRLPPYNGPEYELPTTPEKKVHHNVIKMFEAQNQPKKRKRRRKKKKGGKGGMRPSTSKRSVKSSRSSTSSRPSTASVRATTSSRQRSRVTERPATSAGVMKRSQPIEITKTRISQLQECESIRMTLLKQGITISSKQIQRSLLLPMDLPYQTCASLLPQKRTFLLKNVNKKVPKQTKKKKRRRKGKKGTTSTTSSRPSSRYSTVSRSTRN